MPKVALVFPYFRTSSAGELLFPPLGVATLAAHLRRAGVHSRVFDCTFSHAHAAPRAAGLCARHRRHLLDGQPHGQRPAVAAMVRAELPGAVLVAGGPMPTVFPHRYMGTWTSCFAARPT